MKINQPTYRSYAALLSTSVLCLAAQAQGATLTRGSILSDVSATGGGGSVSNSVGVIATPTLVKFVGDIEIASTNGGSTLGNTLDIGGGITLDAEESFLVAYDFNVEILGGGTFTFTVTGTTDFGGVMDSVSNTDSFSGPGQFSFNFSELGFVAEESVSGDWTGQLAFDWTDAPAGSVLRVEIPNDSIDFAAIPEPSTGALALVASLSLLARRRKMA